MREGRGGEGRGGEGGREGGRGEEGTRWMVCIHVLLESSSLLHRP